MPLDWKLHIENQFQSIVFVLRRKMRPREGKLETVTHPGPR